MLIWYQLRQGAGPARTSAQKLFDRKFTSSPLAVHVCHCVFRPHSPADLKAKFKLAQQIPTLLQGHGILGQAQEFTERIICVNLSEVCWQFVVDAVSSSSCCCSFARRSMAGQLNCVDPGAQLSLICPLLWAVSTSLPSLQWFAYEGTES